jgi:hypothetical protein
MANQADREELMSSIDHMFIQLVNEYNPNRGVDFPYYIKKMLELRTYHHVSRYIKNINKELFAATEEQEIIIEDHSYEEIFKRIIDIHSLDPEMELGEKHRNLLIGLLIERKTLRELAEEEGAPVERLQARLYFLIKKMRKAYEDHKYMYGDDIYE